MNRACGSRAAISASASRVPSLLPSSTYTISERRPIRNSTAVKRRCSSSTVPTSLKSGTTTESCSPPGLLRDMTKTPSNDVSEVVSNQIDALAGDHCARFHAAQEVELLAARFDQPRAGPRQLVVRVAGMHHQLRHTGTNRPQETVERGLVEDARVDSPHEPGRA